MSDYRKDPRGFLVRIQPRQYRRGRAAWKKGELQAPYQRFKYLSPRSNRKGK